MSAHTPGEWYVEETWGELKVYAGERLICTVRDRANDGGRREAFANARLIVAAKDLLAACERAATEMPTCCDPDCRSVMLHGSIVRDLKAAIAEARGLAVLE